MLTICKRALPVALIGVAALIVGLTGTPGDDRPAHRPATSADMTAQGGADCPDNDRNCDVWDEEEPSVPPPGGGTGNTGGGSGVCTFNNGDGTITVGDDQEETQMLLVAQTGLVEVPCYLDAYGWYDGTGCYYGDFPPAMEIPAPPKGKTEEDGRYYYLTCIRRVLGEFPNFSFFQNADLQWTWVDSEDVPEVTPEQVAQDWLATIGLDGVEFSLAPPETGAGLVGLPVWLGVAESADNWGPIADSHCIDDVCVSIEALVTEVEWDMGDSTVFTCDRDRHVAWRPGMDFRAPGGNCHHFYDRASRHLPDRRYQLTATSFWQVSWSRDGAGDSGVIETDRTATASLQIDEIQVLRNR